MSRLFRHRGRAVRAEMREEVEEHIALAAEHLVRRGASPEEAMRRARERFGDFETAMNTLYHSAEAREGAMQRREYWGAVRQDLVFSVRQMRRTPVVAVAIVLTLALGIGANLVMFGIANRLLFSPPTGVVDAGELRILGIPQGPSYPNSEVTNYAMFADLQRAASFASVGGYGFSFPQSLGSGTQSMQVNVGAASASYFTTVGVRPVAGRLFLPEEDRLPRGMPVAMISDAFWQRRFQREPAALGATLPINGRSYRVVGVLPPHFTGLDLKPVDVWLPLTDQSFASNPEFASDRGSKWMMIVARLRPDVSEERALADVNRIVALSDDKMAGLKSEFLSILPGKRGGSRAAANVSAWLVGVAALVLLIACANAATLLLTRAMRRAPEMAVRLALGVSRRRLMMQVGVESALFAISGAIVAAAAAYLTRGVVQSVLLPETDIGPAVPGPVMLLGIGTIALICVLTSLAPALQVNRVDLAGALKGFSGRASEGRTRLRGTLLVLQVAMSAVLIVGAGLFVRSLQNAKNERIGIDTEAAALAEVAVSAIGYSFQQQDEFWQRAVARTRAIPGVASASLTIGTPMRFSIGGRFEMPGLGVLRTDDGPYRFGVDKAFFQTVGARVIRGRAFTDADVAGSSRVVVINETLAKAVAQAGDPIGKCARTYRADTIPCATIIGIVEDISRGGLRVIRSPQYYMPYSQWLGPHSTSMLIRAADGSVEELIPAITRSLQQASPDVPFPRVNSYAQLLDPEMRPWKLGATMFTLFGALAFIISVVGLYGLLAYSVAQRRFEFGIRSALGAQPGDILGIVLKAGLALVTLGLVVGLGAAVLTSKYIGPLLFGVEPRDLVVYGGSAALVLAVTAVVAAIPARRASTVAPIEVLRGE